MVPYASLLGYKKGQEGNLAIDESQAPIVREIYQLFLAGKSIREIAACLETQGHLTPRGKTRWSVTTIRSILSNEKYKGDALLQKTFTSDFLAKTIKPHQGEVPQYYVTGNHEPIIDPDVWDQVQYELTTRHGPGYGSKLHLFSSRLKCADCRGWYGRKTWSSTTNKHTVWHCNNKHTGDHICMIPTLRDHQSFKELLAAENVLEQFGLEQAVKDADQTQVEEAIRRAAEQSETTNHDVPTGGEHLLQGSTENHVVSVSTGESATAQQGQVSGVGVRTIDESSQDGGISAVGEIITVDRNERFADVTYDFPVSVIELQQPRIDLLEIDDQEIAQAAQRVTSTGDVLLRKVIVAVLGKRLRIEDRESAEVDSVRVNDDDAKQALVKLVMNMGLIP